MRIRSITSFFDPNLLKVDQSLDQLASLSQDLQKRLETSVYEVQSTRIATSPFQTFLDVSKAEESIRAVQSLEKITGEKGFSYLSIGPAVPDSPISFHLIPELIRNTRNVFCGGIIADKKQLYPGAAIQAGEVVVTLANLEAEGFANLRFAALANVKPFAPFFPAAYHQPGEKPAFALAIECADEAVKAFSTAGSLTQARERLLDSLNGHAEKLSKLCMEISDQSGIEFRGFDFSLAPFPEDWCSLGKAFELLGLEHIGGAGSLAVAAFIADLLDDGKWLKVGFNGLMLPVLEDSILAARAEQGSLTIKDLLLYSAVCGTGLDTIPLAGDTTKESITALLMDLGALAVRLGKPLTGRLMPIPGKKVGEKTGFDFGFFANSKVMSLDVQVLNSPMMSAPVPLKPRKQPGTE